MRFVRKITDGTDTKTWIIIVRTDDDDIFTSLYETLDTSRWKKDEFTGEIIAK